MDSRTPQASLQDLLYIAFKWKWSMLLVVGVTMASSCFWIFLAREDVYLTQAKILVKAGLEQTPPSSVPSQSAGPIGYRSADVKSEIDILQSSELLTLLVDKYGLDKPVARPVPAGFLPRLKYRVKGAIRWVNESVDEVLIAGGLRERLTAREKAIAMLQRGLAVKALEGSNTIVAELYLPFRKDSGAVLNALVEEYRKFRLTLYRDRSNEYFREAMQRHGGELRQAERELNGFERATQISNQPQQKELLLQQITELERLRHDAEVDYKEADAKLTRLAQEQAKPRANFGSLGGFDHASLQRNLLGDIANLEKKRQELLLTEMEGGDRIRNVENQLQAMAGMLKASLQSVLVEKKARYDSLAAETARIRVQLESIHQGEVRWRDLGRSVRRLEDEYSFYGKKYEESTAARTAMEEQLSGNVAVMQRAMDPLQPAGLRKTVYLALAMFAGLLTALAYVAAGEYFDQRVHSPGQVERYLGVPVVAAVPRRRDMPWFEPSGAAMAASRGNR